MIPRPTGYIRSNWSLDPHTHGSYAFLTPGARPADRATLRAPLSDKVYFAGEHTSSVNPATVHGAQASGSSSAESIIKLTAQARKKNANLPNEKIVVIGAGVAGLAAARALVDQGGYDVTVLESRDRTGGRIHTLKGPSGFESMSDKLELEMGANWVHAYTKKKGGKPLMEELVKLGSNPVKFDWDKSRAWDINKKKDVDQDVMEKEGDKIIAKADSWSEKQNKDISYQTAIEAITTEKLNKSVTNPLDLYLRSNFALDYGARMDEISAWYGTEEGIDGPDAFVLQGYGKLPAMLAEGVDVVLQCGVNEVKWGKDEVEVCTNGGKVYTADRVVVCVPLPIIQKEIIKFIPEIPDKQMKSYKRLSMGLLDKIWLRFDQPFWENKDIHWETIGSTSDSSSSSDKESGKHYSWMWSNMMPLTGEPVLLGVIGGDEARRLATMDDEKVLELAMLQLQAFKDSAKW